LNNKKIPENHLRLESWIGTGAHAGWQDVSGVIAPTSASCGANNTLFKGEMVTRKSKFLRPKKSDIKSALKGLENSVIWHGYSAYEH
jgi:hypothetical protein